MPEDCVFFSFVAPEIFFQFAMQARDSLSGILGGMLYLSTLDIGMSDEIEVSVSQ